jgi:hypothetical protein
MGISEQEFHILLTKYFDTHINMYHTLQINFATKVNTVVWVKKSWPVRTDVAVLPSGDYGGSYGAPVTLEGCKMRNAVLFTQDRLCMMKSHILRAVALLRRTQQI